MKRLGLLVLLLVGCGDKAPAADDFVTELAGLDDKSDKFRASFTVKGTIFYNTTVGPVASPYALRMAYKFEGRAGDKLTVDVRSTSGADPVAWILDKSYNILAYNDDASPNTVASHIEYTLADSDTGPFYLVFRDYYLRRGEKYKLTLKGEPGIYSCTVDSDCAKVRAVDCCAQGRMTAVNASQVEAYETAAACQPPYPPCAPLPDELLRTSGEPQCINNRCELVEIADIQCGGFRQAPHQCPPGFTCQGDALAWDGPGNCVAGAFCGGFAGFACADGESCVDDPRDSCDPMNGGADCGGLCAQ